MISTDFDNIIATLNKNLAKTIESVKIVAEPFAELSDKDVGLRLETLPENVRRFIFPYRKHKGDLMNEKPRDLLFKTIRPTGNKLDGYMPSYAINRVMSEAG